MNTTPEARVPEIQDSDFEELLNNNTLVIVDFMVSWCGPCRKVARFMDKLAEEFVGQITIVKMDTEKNKDIPKQFEVSRLPEVLLFKNGELVDRILGAKPHSTFAEAVTKQL
jgi:thioredoxin 1